MRPARQGTPAALGFQGTWINGAAGHRIDCRDRGLQYGDGLFETMRVRDGRIRLLEYHLDRLFDGCRRMSIDAPRASALRRELVLRARPQADAVLKLILTRGSGARGYRPSGRERCTRILSLSAVPPFAAAQSLQRVRICATTVGSNPALAGLKTLNRLDSVLARSEWSDERVWEGLMRDIDGNLVCGTMSNLFVRRGSTLTTPALDRCGIAGVMRRWVLEQAERLRLRPRQGTVGLEQLDLAAEVFMTNAVAGVVSVKVIEHGRRRIRIGSSSAADGLRARLELE
ncbi:MAG: aminodeoxychorismate lyase [Steroidobacteraceae bacterium]|jgi:4-amino-4-deoxychorismate lyase